jgi:hypothetical protein
MSALRRAELVRALALAQQRLADEQVQLARCLLRLQKARAAEAACERERQAIGAVVEGDLERERMGLGPDWRPTHTPPSWPQFLAADGESVAAAQARRAAEQDVVEARRAVQGHRGEVARLTAELAATAVAPTVTPS